MTAATAKSPDDYSTFALVRRLLVDEALGHWPRYAIAFVLMGISAAATALTAYLIGSMTNEAYVNRNYHGIVVIGLIAMVIFVVKGFATYGAAVTLSMDRQSHHCRQSGGACSTDCCNKTSKLFSPTAIRPSSSPGSPPAPPR